MWWDKDQSLFTMVQPFFNDISRDINGLLNRDFFHASPLALNVSTTTENGMSFSLKGKQTVKAVSYTHLIINNIFYLVSGPGYGLSLIHI